MPIREARIICFISSVDLGQGRDPPAFAATFDGVAHLRIQHVEETDPRLRHDLLQTSSAAKASGMLSGSGRIRTASSSTIKSTALRHRTVLSSGVKGRKAARLSLLVEQIQIGVPLRGVNARQSHHAHCREEKRWRFAKEDAPVVPGKQVRADDAWRHGFASLKPGVVECRFAERAFRGVVDASNLRENGEITKPLTSPDSRQMRFQFR